MHWPVSVSFSVGYRKISITQTVLVWLIEKWKHQLDKNAFACVILMDLSNAFNSKTSCRWFWGKCFRFSLSYLKNRKPTVQINTIFSTWTDLIIGLTKGSVLGPLFLNIYLNDLFATRHFLKFQSYIWII